MCWLRAYAVQNPDPGLTALIEKLRSRSERFRMLWSRHDVTHDSSGKLKLAHPQVGPLTLHFQHMTLGRSGHVRCLLGATGIVFRTRVAAASPGIGAATIGGAGHPGTLRSVAQCADGRESTHGCERNLPAAITCNTQPRKEIGPAMTTPKVIFDPFAGDFFSDCVTRIVGSVGEESVYCDAK